VFHGRVEQGEVVIGSGPQGVRLDSPEHHDAEDAKVLAYVRPHDLDVERYTPGTQANDAARPRGIVARLSRAIVVGPIARLELIPEDAPQAGEQTVIEAQIPASQYRKLGLAEGDVLVLTPRKARVFVEGNQNFAHAA